MRNCGRILDSDKGKKMMNKYFDRMTIIQDNKELKMRIRLMIREVIELSREKWVKRKEKKKEGKMKINKISDEENRNSVRVG
jgi:translation initiation factor 4G